MRKTVQFVVELEIAVDSDVEFDVKQLIFRLNEYLIDYRRGEICINRLVDIHDIS